jgi:dTMP kinase
LSERNPYKEIAIGGLLITIEGLDGAGKTTVCQELVSRLDDQNYRYVVSREPGGTLFAEACRALAKDPAMPMTEGATLFLMLAARADHEARVIYPALMANKIVLLDRYTDSTMAYQGELYEHAYLRDMCEIAQGGRDPDLTLYLDISPEEAARRRRARDPGDRMDARGLEWFARVRSRYLTEMNRQPHRIQMVKANRPLREVVAECQKLMATCLRTFQR